MNRSKARETALFYLFSYQFNSTLKNKGLETYEQAEGIRPDEENVSFFEALVTKTLTHASYYDQLITLALQGWSLARLGQVELCLVRLAMAEYELVAFDETFIPILIAEITKLSNAYCEEKSASFLHGLLTTTFHLLTSTCPVPFVEAEESFPDYPTLQSRYESQFSKEVPELERPDDNGQDREKAYDHKGHLDHGRSLERDRKFDRNRRPDDRDKVLAPTDQEEDLEAKELSKPSRPDPAQKARQRSILANSRMVKVIKRRPTLPVSDTKPPTSSSSSSEPGGL